jgi:hypothetical protein
MSFSRRMLQMDPALTRSEATSPTRRDTALPLSCGRTAYLVRLVILARTLLRARSRGDSRRTPGSGVQ